MEVIIKKDNQQIELKLEKQEESFNPIWICEQDKTFESLLNSATEAELLLSETDIDHPLANYRSPSNPNDYVLIQYIISEVLEYELISPDFDYFVNALSSEPVEEGLEY